MPVLHATMRVKLPHTRMLQIYNESIHDLLAPANQRGKPSALRLKEDKAGHIQVRQADLFVLLAFPMILPLGGGTCLLPRSTSAWSV
jgi:hypothetical protein